MFPGERRRGGVSPLLELWPLLDIVLSSGVVVFGLDDRCCVCFVLVLICAFVESVMFLVMVLRKGLGSVAARLFI